MRGSKSWQMFLPRMRVKCPHCGKAIQLRGAIRVRSVSMECSAPTASSTRKGGPTNATTAVIVTDSTTDGS